MKVNKMDDIRIVDLHEGEVGEDRSEYDGASVDAELKRNRNVEGTRHHPTVSASANIVDIDDKSVQSEYYGRVYVGSEAWRVVTLFDTLSDWTIISTDFEI